MPASRQIAVGDIPTVTKRALMNIGADGANNTQTTPGAATSDLTTRLILACPVTTARWRPRFRNYNTYGNVALTGVLNVNGIWLGDPAYPSTGLWAGAFASAPAQAVAAFSTPTDGSEVIGGWVTDPTLQFQAGQVKCLSYGITMPTPVAVVTGGRGSGSWYGTGSAASASGAAVPTTNLAGVRYVLGDLRIEYEYAAIPGSPASQVIAVIGDSIVGDITDANEGYGVFSHEGWPGATALRLGCAVINLGVGSSLLSDWATPSQWRWQKADLVTTVPDRLIISAGTNDVVAGASLSTLQSRLASVVTTARSFGISKIEVGTIIPRNLSGSQETARTGYNLFARSLPFGISRCLDFDKAMFLQATPAVSDPDLTTNNLHPNHGGYQRMALTA